MGRGSIGSKKRDKYVNLLVDRCFFKDVYGSMRWMKSHDIVRDMSIFIVEKAKNCFCRTIQHLQNFLRPHATIHM